MRQDDNPMLEAAKLYRSRGYMPVPVPIGEKGPRIKGWNQLRPRVDELPSLFNKPCNIGLLLGEPSGWLVDVDLDCDEAVALADSALPPTAAITGRGERPGSHRWYICKGATTTKHADPVTREMIVELRSTGQQTLVGPSTHPTGDLYEMLEGEPAVVTADALATAVASLANEVARLRGHQVADAPQECPPPSAPQPSPDTPTHASIPMPDRIRRCTAYLQRCPDAVSDAGGHNATLRAACECFRFGLDRPAALTVMQWFNDQKTAGETWNETQLAHKLDDAERIVAESNETGARLTQRTGHPPASDLRQTAAQLTDVGNAARFVLQHGDRFRYCYQTGRWLVWDGRRWETEGAGEVTAACKQTALSILKEAWADDSDGRSKKLTWASSSQRRERIVAMASLAQPDLALRANDLDADPWLLNCLSGTLDLRTKTLRPHDPADLITKLAPVPFEPDARCPLFEQFLDRIFQGDDELIAFVQQWHGHCLTADIRYQYLPIYHGEGNNGKSVLLDTITPIMGDYACEAAPELLTAHKHAQHPTEIADLMGRRLVTASETEEGAALRTQTLKRLTGNARLKGRFMRQDFIEFPRTHKMVLVTNNRPEIPEDSEAVWRRILLVPFRVIIPAHERDPALLEKLKAEWPGILAWMVRGCPAPGDGQLVIPDSVRSATAGYRGYANSLQEFILTQCELKPGVVTQSSEIVDRYESWAKEQGKVIARGKALGTALLGHGCTKVLQKRRRAWAGIALSPVGLQHKQRINGRSPVEHSKEQKPGANRQIGGNPLHPSQDPSINRDWQ